MGLVCSDAYILFFNMSYILLPTLMCMFFLCVADCTRHPGVICAGDQSVTCFCESIAQHKTRVRCHATDIVTELPLFKYQVRISTSMMSLHGMKYRIGVEQIIRDWPALKLLSIEDTNIPCDPPLIDR